MKTKVVLAGTILTLFLAAPIAAEDPLAPPPPPGEDLPIMDEGGGNSLPPLDTAQPDSYMPDGAGIPDDQVGGDAPIAGTQPDPENAVYEPSYDQHYYIEGVALFRQKQYEEADELFSKIGPGSRYFASAVTYRGLMASRLGNYRLAYAIYQSGLKANPANEDLNKRVTRMLVLMERAELFGARGPVKSITTYVRTKPGSSKVKESVTKFNRDGYPVEQIRYKGGKKFETVTYAFHRDGTLKKILVAGKDGTLKESSEWSRDPMDAAGKAKGDVWVAVEKDAKKNVVRRKIWTDFDSHGRPRRYHELDKDGSEVRREEYAYDGDKVLIEVFESGTLAQRQEETRDKYGNPVKAMRDFKEITYDMNYDEFGNWTSRSSSPAEKGRAVVVRELEYWGR